VASIKQTGQKHGQQFQKGSSETTTVDIPARNPFWNVLPMLLTRLLNACHHFPGFVYDSARLCTHSNTIEIDVRARKGSGACCSGCHQPARGYDQLPQRRFEFIRSGALRCFYWYSMRRVECRRCGSR